MCFSSLAVVAIAAAAAASGLLPGEAAVWVVLGANFGDALLALLSTLGSSSIARRAPLGNFFFRIAACAAGAAFPSTNVKLMAPENLVSSATALALAEEETAKTSRLFSAFWPKAAVPFCENPPAGVMLARRCRDVERFLNVLLRLGRPAAEAVEDVASILEAGSQPAAVHSLISSNLPNSPGARRRRRLAGARCL